MSLRTPQSGSLGNCVKTVSALAHLQVVPPRHCVTREFTKVAFCENVNATLEPCATSLSVPGHLWYAIGRRMPGLVSPGSGHRIEELFATNLLMIWHLLLSRAPVCFCVHFLSSPFPSCAACLCLQPLALSAISSQLE